MTGEGSVERGGVDAVVERQAADEDAPYAARAELLGEVGAVEARVGLLVAPGRLLDGQVDLLLAEPRVEVGAARAGHAVVGPLAAVFGEREVVVRVPVLRGDDRTEA